MSDLNKPPPYDGAAPPQQPGYPAPAPQPYPPQPGAPTVVVAQPTNVAIVGPPSYGQVPVNITCGNCGANVVTTLEYNMGMLVWLIVGLLFLFGWWLCCWIPCVITSLKDVTHKCPNCKIVLGKCPRLG